MMQENKMKILIVDDEYYNIIGLKVILEMSLKQLVDDKYKDLASEMVEALVDTANNGQEAVEKVKNS